MEILILDDNQEDLENINATLISLGYSKIYKTTNLKDALNLVKKHDFELVITDYLLSKGTTSKELMASSDLNSKVKFIVLTNYFEKTVKEDLIETRPFIFMKKGFDSLELEQAIDFVKNIDIKLPKSDKAIESTFFIKLGDSFKSIALNDVLYFEVDGKYANIHCFDRTFVIRTTLTNLEKRIGKNFIRVHSAYLVNVSHIESFKPSLNIVILKGGKEVPFSRKYKQNLIDGIVLA